MASCPCPPRDIQEVPTIDNTDDGVLDITDSSDEYHNIETRHVAIEKQQHTDGVVHCKNDDHSNENDKDDDDNDSSITSSCSRTFKLNLTSNMLFVVASFLYVLLSAYDLDYAYLLLSTNNSNSGGDDVVSDMDDGDVWLTKSEAKTTTATMDDYYAADDDGYGSAELTELYTDDDYYLFVTKNGTWVSRYQIIYFVAALCFVFSGVVDFIHNPGWFLSVIFIIAGCFGLVSAMLVEEYEYLSNVFNSVSAHLFMVEAVGLFLHHRHTEIIANGGAAAAAASKQQQLLMLRLQCLVRLGDVSFIAGTCMDVILSYCYIRGTGESIPQAIVSVVAANLWLLCSLIYLMATCITECQVRKQQVDMLKAHETSDESSSSSSLHHHDKDMDMP